MEARVVPAAFKSAYLCPWLKKSGLDAMDVKNYRTDPFQT